MFNKKYKNIILLLSLVLFIGVGFLNQFNDILILITLSIVFTIGIYILFLLFDFKLSTPINAVIINASYGYTDMNRGVSNRYFINYIFKNKKYTRRLGYSTSSRYKVGDTISILVTNENKMIITQHLKYFIFFDIFFIFLSIFFLFLE